MKLNLDKKDIFETLSFELSEILNENHINAEIYGREKTPFQFGESTKKKNFIRSK